MSRECTSCGCLLKPFGPCQACIDEAEETSLLISTLRTQLQEAQAREAELHAAMLTIRDEPLTENTRTAWAVRSHQQAMAARAALATPPSDGAKRIERLLGALEFYASTDNWYKATACLNTVGFQHVCQSDVELENQIGGLRARAALAEWKGTP